MLTYEKDVVPVKMTAWEAHKRSVGTDEDYIELLIEIYDFISKEVAKCNTSINCWIGNPYLADRVFNELVKQGYNVNLEKDMGAEKVWHLSIEWKNVDLDPNKKYILPMEGTEEHQCLGGTTQGYAYKNKGGVWTICHVFGTGGVMDERVVTAKDIEDAPDWVKAIEPVEV
ncbi:hypothetical protein [Limosilactobacillus reuteri]|uniref:hypothetical protein n=1 Tax=Limosilactobacillus reuteri TaxID=1598 RepID=UPI001E3EF0BF|nr:hypothetical protein [Limosilactobacillus reuteri]MCC4359144.1 hypothetical protein [Limosilactobacillus reuteri]MCC4361717.1 hypothetical protein [Limosilactobacillus reuteri]MCC4365446.1 hypothetical protein [Limosilactobacillus reuteri]